MTDIKVPPLGESVSEATIATWLKNPGDAVQLDEPLIELETDKVTLEVNAPAFGVLGDVKFAEGDTVEEGDLLGVIAEGAVASAGKAAPAPQKAPQGEAAPVPQAPLTQSSVSAQDKLAPSVAKMVSEQGINPAQIQGTGKEARVLKGDVLNFSAR